MAPKAMKTKSALQKAWAVEVQHQPIARGKSDEKNDLGTRVRKAINDNLRDTLTVQVTEQEIYGTVINGRTCYQQVMHDKELWIKGERAPMGSKYWQDIRCLYQGPDNMRKMIIIPPGTQIDKEVIAAVDAALRHPPQRGPILGVCRRAASYKRGNSLALMKLLTSVCASASAKQLELGVEIIESLHRVGAFLQLPEMTAILRPKLDSILLQVERRDPGNRLH
eukprot:6472834-Amphidinium_carterae.3